jgi:hypothetical protein
MKKLKFYSLALIGALAFSPVLISCDDDDDDKVEILLPIAGDYTGAETCDAANGVPSEYDMHIYNSANDPNTIWIENAYGFAKIKGTWDGGNGFTVPSQEISIKSGATTYKGKISGSGRVEGNELTFDFVTTDDLEDKCTFKGKREVVQPAVGG